MKSAPALAATAAALALAACQYPQGVGTQTGPYTGQQQQYPQQQYPTQQQQQYPAQQQQYPQQQQQQGGARVYTVQPGDTLGGIARHYGTTVPAIVAANPAIVDPNAIRVGQEIVLPGY